MGVFLAWWFGGLHDWLHDSSYMLKLCQRDDDVSAVLHHFGISLSLSLFVFYYRFYILHCIYSYIVIYICFSIVQSIPHHVLRLMSHDIHSLELTWKWTIALWKTISNCFVEECVCILLYTHITPNTYTYNTCTYNIHTHIHAYII